MKQNKQQHIDTLTKTLDEERIRNQKLEDILSNLKRDLASILKIDDWCGKNFEFFKSEISKLQGRVIAEGQMLPLINHEIMEENSKLWYLIRVAMKDEKNVEPFNMQTGMSRFTKPNFNN